MTPTLELLEVARPRCWRRVIARSGQQGRHFTCYTPMRYVAAANVWWCPACERQTPAADVVARQGAEAA
jgi:hypothetical protein